MTINSVNGIPRPFSPKDRWYAVYPYSPLVFQRKRCFGPREWPGFMSSPSFRSKKVFIPPIIGQ